MSNDELKQPMVNEPIKNAEIEIRPINQPNFSVNYPASQGYFGKSPQNKPPNFIAGPMPMPGQPGYTGPNQGQTGPGFSQMVAPSMGQMGGSMGVQMMGNPLGNPMGGPMGGPGGPIRVPLGGPVGQPMWGPAGGPMGAPPGQNRPGHNDLQGEDEYSNMVYEKSYPCYENCMQTCCSCCGQCRQFCVCLCVEYPNIEVPQSYCGLKMRFGRYVETMYSGLQFITPSTEKLILVDLQTQTLDLVKQNIITKDNITATIDTAINYKIINPRYALFRLTDLKDSVTNITFSALRTVCGGYTLNELQSKKQEITHQLQAYIGDRVKQWGIIIEQIFIKDLILSADLQLTLSSAAKMQRAAESKVISAKADVESAKLMKEAAESLSSEAAMQIRYFETISHLAASPSQKIVFIPFIQEQE